MQPIPPLPAWQSWQVGPEYPRWTELLRDHSQVLIRPLRKEDGEAERIFIESLSPQARRYRFLGEIVHPSRQLVEQLTKLDYRRDLAFVAVVPDGSADKFVGISRYSSNAEGTDCEFAVSVLDDWQNKGLGVALMTHLIEVARSLGIKRMWSMDSAENLEMSELAHYMGFQRERDPDDSAQVIHSLWL
jgi:GNAT superfamily N-acetyltransferase